MRSNRSHLIGATFLVCWLAECGSVRNQNPGYGPSDVPGGDASGSSGGGGGVGTPPGSDDGGGGPPGPSGDAGSIVINLPATDGAASDANACASERRKGTVIPVDIFLMVDQSGSMLDTVPGGTKWSLLTQALTTFVNDPGSAGIGAGIGYFPIPPIDNSSCDAGTYAVPDVPIAFLPGNAMPIVASITAHTPGGQTPTVAALTGAIDYATAWALSNPTHKVVVAYATDGAPHGCTNNTIAVASAVAQAAAAGTPPISTYVIGIGKSLTALNQIAQAAGTGQAFSVDTGQNTATQFLAAMNMIRSATLVPCEYTIPAADGGAVDYGKVNVVGTPSDGGAPLAFLQVADATKCDPNAGGWYYDVPAAPTKIELCPTSCTVVEQDVTEQVDVLLGCKTMTAQ